MKSTVRIAVAMFSYGGNGGVASVIPELMVWWGNAYHRLMKDPRVETVITGIYSDTPVYMTRNLAVKEAIEAGCDMLLMLDSDNEPDAYYGKDPGAKLFLDEPFTFAFDRLKQGIPTVIAAPYCGPPPHPIRRPGISDGGEVPYLFQWTNIETNGQDSGWKQEMLTRREAERLAGIHPMSSLPTGVCLFTTNIFKGPPRPYFDYEHDKDKTEKRGTEDCFGTRNLSVYWKIKKNYDVCFAACDSWALHNKPKRVGKPHVATLELVSQEMRESLLTTDSNTDELRIVDYTTPPTPFAANFESPYSTTYARTDSALQGDGGLVIDKSRLKRRFDRLTHEDTQVLITAAEMEEAETLLKREIETGNQFADIRMPEEGRETVPAAANPIQAAVEQAFEDPDYAKSNGKKDPLRYGMVGNRKVALGDREIPRADLNAIQDLAEAMTHKQGGPVEVAIAHPGTGQSAAAILFELPEGSHLHAFDCVQTYKSSTMPSEQFAASFQPELENGRVLADLSGRKFPWPAEHEQFDLVFIERSITREKLETWMNHVSPNGVLAGFGDVGIARKFAEDNDFEFADIGSVWTISNG